jgi:predicted dienelactone hydrolase
MKHLAHILALLFALTAGQATGQAKAQTSVQKTAQNGIQDHAIGLRKITVSDGDRTRPLKGLLWYPAAPDTRMRQTHSNGVWVGVPAAKRAKLAQGTFPLLVLSHGMMGNKRNQNWLAADLVRAGYIVATLSHPGTSTWLRDQDDARQLWERPRDISRMITHLLGAPRVKDQIDPARIYMGGHSLGGWTALSLAGGLFDGNRFHQFCNEGLDPDVCDVLQNQWDIGNTEADRARLAQSALDPRIKAFAIFDLGGTQFFTPASIDQITADMLVIGAPGDIGNLNLDRESRALAAMLAPQHVTYLEPDTLSHYDFLGLCKPRAIEILEDEVPGDGIICMGGGEERSKDHALITSAVLAHFAAH